MKAFFNQAFGSLAYFGEGLLQCFITKCRMYA